MTKRVYVHVGCPKSGTTYLQRVLRHNQDSLAEQGVLVAGRTHGELVHAGFVIRQDRRLRNLPPKAAQSWDRIVRQIREFPGETAIVSYELLAGARRRQARAALAPLGDLEVHLVISTRDLGRAVSSAWQERLKFGLDTPLGQWQPRPASDGPRAEWGWRTMDPASVAARWGAGLAPHRVHIVVAPRGGASPTALWDRFAEACSLEDVGLDLDVRPANESLGVRAAEVLRRVNEHDHGPIQGAREQSRWLRDTLAHAVLAGLDDEPMGITDAQLAEAEERAEEAITRIQSSGWQVHGDLEDVRATRRQGRMPEGVPAEELLGVATRAIVDLLVELRAARQGSGPDDDQSARRPVVDLGGGRSRSQLDELGKRLDSVEDEVQESRRLQERVASLTDLVTELLLPTADQDDDAIDQALRDYRDTSL